MKTSAIPLLLALCAIALGCGAPERPGPEPAPSLVIAWDPAPANLDSRVGADISSGRLADLLYSGLIRVAPSGDYLPDLATKWETPDDRTIVFQLRPGVTFHDGRSLTAKDVKFTFESLMSAGFSSPKKSGYVAVERIEG